MNHRRVILYRWHQHWQFDIRTPGGFLCLGWRWRYGPSRPVAYWSPDATPSHGRARGPWRARVG